MQFYKRILNKIHMTILLFTINTKYMSINDRNSNLTLAKLLEDTINALSDLKEDVIDDCAEVSSFPMIDTSKVTDMSHLFEGCKTLKSIPSLDTSNATDMSYMFYDCNDITYIPDIDTNRVQNMDYMFAYCASLNDIPTINTSIVKSMRGMFYGTSPMIEDLDVEQFNTIRVQDMRSMFENAKFIVMPEFNTESVYSMRRFCYNNDVLTTVPQLNMIRCKTANTIYLKDSNGGTSDPTEGMFYNCRQLQHLGGFYELSENLDLSYSPLLTKESIINVFNNLSVIKEGTKTITLPMNAEFWNELTSEDIAIAQNKGWRIAKADHPEEE